MIPFELQRVIITTQPKTRVWYEVRSTLLALSIILIALCSIVFLAIFQRNALANISWIEFIPPKLSSYVWMFFPEALTASIGFGLLAILIYSHTDWRLSYFSDIIGGVLLFVICTLYLGNSVFSPMVLNSGLHGVDTIVSQSQLRSNLHQSHISNLDNIQSFYGQITQITSETITIDNFGIPKTFLYHQKRLYIGAKIWISYNSENEVTDMREV
jgi:hypothetical protein